MIKSFVLIFPPAVIMSLSGYMLPNYFIAFAVNMISIILSLSIPYFLGRFAGAGLIDTLKNKFKAVRKIDDFVGMNEIKMTAIVKFSGIMPGDVSSLLFGAMNTGYKNYMIGSTLGNIPLVLAYTLFGTLLKNIGEKPWVVSVPIVIIISFLLISSLLVKKTVDNNKKNDLNDLNNNSEQNNTVDNQ